MPIDPRVEPPEQPKTVELPAADRNEVLLAELKQLMVSGFKDLDAKVDRLEANLDLQGGEIGLVKKEVDLLFAWRGDIEQRLKSNSQRAESASKADLEQAAQIAQERAAREELAAKVDALSATNATQLAILSRLDKVASNPLAKTIFAMLATAFTTWLATKGIRVP